MSLNSFITHIKQIGLPLASHYEVIVPIVDGASTSKAQTVSMLCNAATLPGHNIMTTELRIFGEVSERPHGINYMPVSLTFIVDNDFSAVRYFNEWSNSVFDRSTRELGYYSEYTRDIEIVVFNREDQEIERYKLYEAYPKTTQDIPLDYSQHNTLSFNVQLVYKWWESVSKTNDKVVDTKEEINKDQLPTYGTENLDLSTEGLGNFTSGTFSGRGVETNPSLPSFGDPGTAFQQAGMNIVADSGRSLLQAGNLFSVSSIANGQFPSAGADLVGLSSTLRDGYHSLGNSVSSIGDLSNVSGSMPSMSSALSGIAIATSNVANIMSGFGGSNSEINQNVGEILRVTNYLSSVSNRSELPNYLNSVSASLSSIGSNINNSIGSMKGSPSFDRSAEVAFNYISSVFNNSGSLISQASNSITK